MSKNKSEKDNQRECVNTLSIRQIPVSELKEYENNPRRNDGAVSAVAESIRNFGFKVPIIIDRNGVIVAGHTRLKAARVLGLETVPCIVADDLTPEQIKAFRLVDNKTAELADWDFSALELELSELSEMNLDFDMSDFGFESDNFEDLGGGSLGDEKPKDYSIVYEIAFNSEEEQDEWYDFLGALKRKYPEVDTIAERILIVTREWLANET